MSAILFAPVLGQVTRSERTPLPELSNGKELERIHGGAAGMNHRWTWATLAAVLALYVFSATRIRPISYFGYRKDDQVYFSSAKSLATGHGYILPSFPARLPGMKYPELYPLVLSVIWRLDPHFPSNVNFGATLTLLFGCSFLIIAFSMLRRWPGVGDAGALAAVALCAFSLPFLLDSACMMTDIPFAAMALGAMLLADRSRGSSHGVA